MGWSWILKGNLPGPSNVPSMHIIKLVNITTYSFNICLKAELLTHVSS